MSRRGERLRVDLRALPAWAQAAIGVGVVAAVSLLAVANPAAVTAGRIAAAVIVALLALAVVAFAVSRRR